MRIGQDTTNEPGYNNTTNGSSNNGDGGLFLARQGSNALCVNRNGTDGHAVRFCRGGSLVGNISVYSSSTSYNTSSDYRLKEDDQNMVGSIDRLKQLRPINFAWKIDGDRTDGFFAHEVAEIVPEAITGAKDAIDDEGNPDYQGIDQSKLVPLLVSAVQELTAKVEALEAQLNA